LICDVQSGPYNIKSIHDEIDISNLESLILNIENVALIKPHSLFDLTSTVIITQNSTFINQIIKPYLLNHLTDLIPEEIIILSKLLSKI